MAPVPERTLDVKEGDLVQPDDPAQEGYTCDTTVLEIAVAEVDGQSGRGA
jgi:hypothetical protein